MTQNITSHPNSTDVVLLGDAGGAADLGIKSFTIQYSRYAYTVGTGQVASKRCTAQLMVNTLGGWSLVARVLGVSRIVSLIPSLA